MNKLPLETRAQILHLLCEGSSMRAISRIVGVSINTVTKLLVDAGLACAAYHDEHVRNVKAKRVQCDEIWAFCYSKQKHVAAAKAAPAGAGDVWTWTAIETTSKLIVSYLSGGRDGEYALALMDDLRSRLATRVQLTTDGHKAYLNAVEEAFGDDVDYAMLVKLYGEAPESMKGRYSPADCIGTRKTKITGNPDKDHVSTSYVERANLTMRMGMRRFTRLTNAHSKKLANHHHAQALYFLFYNFARVNQAVRMSPAMAAGIEGHLWEMKDIAELVEAHASKPKRPATYRKRGDAATISN
ncbi:MAG TPA: helix-turn-helix domain-containing protein [Stellaceae bacterium]|nr:helix-turn-helix domain-containing protein [Stellaceae bacterium]